MKTQAKDASQMTQEEIRLHNKRADKLQNAISICAIICGIVGAVMMLGCAGASDQGTDTTVTWILAGIAAFLEVLAVGCIKFLEWATK